MRACSRGHIKSIPRRIREFFGATFRPIRGGFRHRFRTGSEAKDAGAEDGGDLPEALSGGEFGIGRRVHGHAPFGMRPPSPQGLRRTCPQRPWICLRRVVRLEWNLSTVYLPRGGSKRRTGVQDERPCCCPRWAVVWYSLPDLLEGVKRESGKLRLAERMAVHLICQEDR